LDSFPTSHLLNLRERNTSKWKQIKNNSMKRSLILILCSLFVFSFAYSQSSAESKTILDNAYQQFEKSNGVKLSFILTTEDANGDVYEPQNGTAFVKQDKFKLELLFATTWFDGKTQWVLLKDANEVNISNPAPQELITISPLALLNLYKTGYNLGKPIKKTIKGKELIQIEMSPIDKSQEFKELTITLDKKTNSVTDVSFTTKDGIKSSLAITNYQIDNDFTNDLFTFNKYNHPGVEVIDLR
ncbi:MAG: LolA-like putative outer membrane lipoprotein chaperone, partial [Dysgonamonadaceae bacterium]|nr:LolA-like putative outer membrane lipoprotein chaperone [Dysgonamonadaceae bacterium]